MLSAETHPLLLGFWNFGTCQAEAPLWALTESASCSPVENIPQVLSQPEESSTALPTTWGVDSWKTVPSPAFAHGGYPLGPRPSNWARVILGTSAETL